MSAPLYDVPLEEDCTCFDTFLDNDELIVIFGSQDSVTCGTLEMEDELEPSLKFRLRRVKSLSHPVPVQHIAISKLTNLSLLPRKLVFATASDDHSLRIYRIDLSDEEANVFSDLRGHTSFINSIRFDDSYGQYLASTSDDHTCRLWSTETGSCLAVYSLTSPGAAVCWHPEEPVRLLVAEKKGIIRIYDVTTHKVVRTIDGTGVAPLLAVDWDKKNKSRIIVGANASCYLWDINRPSRPLESYQHHSETVSKVVFGGLGDYTASLGYPGPSVKAVGEDLDAETPKDALVGKSLASHPSQPYTIIGSIRKLLLLRIPMKA